MRKPAPTTTDQKIAPGLRKPAQRLPPFRPGRRLVSIRREGATGGPANSGIARANEPRTYPRDSLNQVQPSWREFEDDFLGFAGASKKPDTSGGGAHYSHGDLKANSFRALGDLHGGRQ